MIAHIDQDKETIVMLTAAGVAVGDMTAKLWEEGDLTYRDYALTASEWTDLGNRYYRVKIKAEEITKFGSIGLMVWETATPANSDSAIFDVVPVPREALLPEGICEITANVVEISGQSPKEPVKFTVRVENFPIESGDSFVSAMTEKAYSDANGDVKLHALRNAVIIIEADMIGFRLKITVPDQPTALLKDFIP